MAKFLRGTVVKKSKTMIGIGEILWDFLPGGKQLGGAPANFAFHCGQLGNQGMIISSVGADALGTEITERLQQHGVGGIIDVNPTQPTGTVTVTMTKPGSPEYTIHEQVAWDYLEAENRHLELVSQADVICFGSLASRSDQSAQAIIGMLHRCKENCLTIFDINLRQHYYTSELVTTLLDQATVLKLNQHELSIVAEMFDLQGTEDQLLTQLCDTFNLTLVTLTRGEQGSRLFSPAMGDSEMAVLPVKIIDTVGAGDAFTAAVATGLSEGLELPAIHTLATRLAGYVCSHAGATPILAEEYKVLSR